MAVAFPFAETQTLDTLINAVAEHQSVTLPQIFSDSGEYLLADVTRKGRLFVIPDRVQITQPLLYQAGGGTVFAHVHDDFGDKSSASDLDLESKDIIGNAKFTLSVYTQNVTYPASMPVGENYNYMNELFRSVSIQRAYEMESMFWLGRTDGVGATPVVKNPYDGDATTGWSSTIRSMSCLALVKDQGADETFAGIDQDSAAKWAPGLFSASNSDGSELINDIDDFARQLSYGQLERPTDVWVGDSVFAKIVQLKRDAASPGNPTHVNFGDTSRSMQHGDLTIHAHRMLDTASTVWDFSAATTAEYPIIFLNMNSLRLNVVGNATLGVTGDSQVEPELGLIKTFPGSWPIPGSTNWFKRTEMKYQWSLDQGRRSFGHMEGVTLA